VHSSGAGATDKRTGLGMKRGGGGGRGGRGSRTSYLAGFAVTFVDNNLLSVNSLRAPCVRIIIYLELGSACIFCHGVLTKCLEQNRLSTWQPFVLLQTITPGPWTPSTATSSMLYQW
jgi:hypothetical protein